MAYPVIVTADSKSGSGNAASYNGDYPDNLVAGDLILLLHGNRGRHAVTAPGSPWVTAQRGQGGGGDTGSFNTVMWGKKVSDGTESGGTFSVSIAGGSTGYAYFCLRIQNWGGTLGTTFDNTTNSGHVEVLYAEGNSSTPDPPNLDPANWTTLDTLWLADVVGRESLGTFSSYPLGSYQDGISISDLRHYRCGTTSTVSSLDPGTFSFSGGDDWIASTLAIKGVLPSRVYQEPVEVSVLPTDEKGRTYQEPVEVAVWTTDEKGRTYQVPVEVAVKTNPPLRVTQDVAESIVLPTDQKLRVSQSVAESVIAPSGSKFRVSQGVVETIAVFVQPTATLTFRSYIID